MNTLKWDEAWVLPTCSGKGLWFLRSQMKRQLSVETYRSSSEQKTLSVKLEQEVLSIYTCNSHGLLGSINSLWS